ncbi:glycogen debranching protein GlgX [Pelotomaculum propionicicum]|uniref:glycogen debranching protein GlgX n=1 Tax=Pelotomaculum propionicicum TaxID=258475 RepID=UPI003B7859C5
MVKRVREGSCFPQGATPAEGGVNFALFSRHAEGVDLLLFDRPQDSSPAEIIQIINRTRFVWHCFVEGVTAGQLYAYRVRGPYQPQNGLRFNPNRLLIDPYARAITGKFVPGVCHLGYDPASTLADFSFNKRGNAGGAPKCIVIDDRFDWEGDVSPRVPLRETVIYEVHLKGLTAHVSSGVKYPGTYLGVVEKIPYLKSLGITAVEFLPLHHCHSEDALVKRGLTNYWGYNTLGYFAPDSRFSTGWFPGCQVQEFKQMVKSLHKEGIEIILDVVYNHTCEGDERGPTLCFRGIDNPTYYKLQDDKRYYKDYSGCGNTLNFDEFQVVQMVMDSLRYWVKEMHVDGFRFDLATVLGREKGCFSRDAGFFAAVRQDPVLAGVKLIAEPWDACCDSNQVGNFPLDWAEWNGSYRDCVRKFIKGVPGMLPEMGYRLTGSSDLFADDGRSPFNSINYVTCHDGFTLNDLVSYEKKHNGVNLEGNKDGVDENHSFNCGHEGETFNQVIKELRKKNIKNFFALLLISQGVPMILGGDEFLRTQRGNNNAYCQDNGISYFDWSLADINQDLIEYVRKMIAFRKRHPHFRQEGFFTGRDLDLDAMKDINWYSEDLASPDWGSPEKGFLAFLIQGSELTGATGGEKECDILVVLNALKSGKVFNLPRTRPGAVFSRILDTSLPYGRDLLADEEAAPLPGRFYEAAPQSVVILLSKITGK